MPADSLDSARSGEANHNSRVNPEGLHCVLSRVFLRLAPHVSPSSSMLPAFARSNGHGAALSLSRHARSVRLTHACILFLSLNLREFFLGSPKSCESVFMASLKFPLLL